MPTPDPVSLQVDTTMDTLPLEVLDVIADHLNLMSKLMFAIARGKEAHTRFLQAYAATLVKAKGWYNKNIRDGDCYYYRYDFDHWDGGYNVRWLKVAKATAKTVVLERLETEYREGGISMPGVCITNQKNVVRTGGIIWAPATLKVTAPYHVGWLDTWTLYRPQVSPFVYCDRRKQEIMEEKWAAAFN